MCSAAVKVFLDMHMHTFLHLLHEFLLYVFSCSNHCHCARESTVHHLVGRKQSHCDSAVQLLPCMWIRIPVGEAIQHWFNQFEESGEVEMHK
jgi:hypothetical protein